MWAQSGETGDESQLRVSSQRWSRNEVFHRNFVCTVQLTSLDMCISFILPASSKRDASLRRWRYAVEAKLELSQLQNPLSTCTPLRRKSTRIQAQLHTPGVEVDQNVKLQLFSQTARLCFDRVRSSADIMHDRRQGNWSYSCQEIPRPMSRSLWPFRAMMARFFFFCWNTHKLFPSEWVYVRVQICSAEIRDGPCTEGMLLQDVIVYPPWHSVKLRSMT